MATQVRPSVVSAGQATGSSMISGFNKSLIERRAHQRVAEEPRTVAQAMSDFMATIEPQAPILNRLADVGRGQLRRPSQVRDCARDLEHAVIRAGRETLAANSPTRAVRYGFPI